MPRYFNRATGWIVDKPWLSGGLVVLLTLIATIGHFSPGSVTGLFQDQLVETDVQTIGSDDEDVEMPPDVEAFSLTGFDAIVVVESDGIFTKDGANCLRAVVESIESLEYVDSVVWMDRVPILNIFGLPEPVFPGARASDQRFAAARQKALDHPFIGGQMLSSDGRTTLLLVRFDFIFITDDAQCIDGLKAAALEAAAQYDTPMEFSISGRVPVYLTAMETHEANQLYYQLVGYGMILIMSIILFRGLVAVGVVALAPILGVFWTVGFIQFFDIRDNPFVDVILPVLVSMVGLTDGVHLMVQIRRLRAGGMLPRDASRTGIYQVGLACGLTSLTTAIGFGSLSMAGHEMIQDFGFCCVIGVILAFIAVVTSIPLACASPLGRWVHRGHEKSLIDKNLTKISKVIDFVLKRQRLMAVIAIIATVTLIGLCLTLRPDERQSNALPEGSEAAVALRKMDEALGGLESSVVEIKWDKSIASDSPEVLEIIGQVDEALHSEELIGHPISVRNLLYALPGDGDVSERMSMIELLPPPVKRSFYQPELRSATVTFRVRDLGIAAYSETFERLDAEFKRIAEENPAFSIEMYGSAVWRWENLYQIVMDLATSVGTASVIIFFVLGIVYRSIRIGLISIVPNMFPLAVSGTYLVIVGQSLEIVTVCAFTVCLGIAVDDTIHFLTRYKELKEEGKEEHTAIREAFTGVGTALIMTTIVLVAGFSTVISSDSHDHRTFAILGVITISSALFADLIFLPALLARFGSKKSSSSA
ncbi:MAG: efflux RND transporter permease subunit [Planctomycetota bacterium]